MGSASWRSSHRWDDLPHVQGPTGWMLEPGLQGRYRDQAVSICLPPGGALLFSADTLHFTAANSSDQSRRAVQYHYIPEAQQ